MTQSHWKLKNQPTGQEISDIQSALSCSRIFAILCYQRGIQSKEALEAYVRPEIDQLHNPYDLYDMERAKERIEKAIISNEKITVYGDYDADGVTSTAIIVETLMMIGANVDYYIPNRFDEGYGPHISSFTKIIDQGTQLIITVDNGVQGHESIDFANEQSVDVIVTDHHELPDNLPNAYAIIHPRHPDGQYPFDDLSGAGVAFKLATAILDEVPYELMDLAAIGTIADLVSLTNENRVITQYGLQLMKQTERPGILSLLQVSETKPGDVDETTIGFRIGPRLNAAGRMGDAKIATELLLAQDMDTAKLIAEELDRLNQTRKQYVEDITNEIISNINEYTSEYINVIAGEGWHEGVIGIVASRIVELTAKPTLILSINNEKGVAKGSGRSIGNINLFEVLNDSKDLMTAFGGHHMAAGLTVPVDKLDQLRENINSYIASHYEKSELIPTLFADVKVKIEDVTIEAINEVDTLSPFGTDNEQPKIIMENVTAKDLRKIGATGNHLKTVFYDDSSVNGIDAVGFGIGDMVDNLGSTPMVDVLCTANINEWNGNRKAQVIIDEIGVTQTQIIDKRKRHFQKDIYDINDTAYVFFTKQVYNAAKHENSSDKHFYYIDSQGVIPQITENKVLFADCPPNEEIILNVLQNNQFDLINAVFFSFEEVYLNGMGSREEFAKVYRYLMNHKNMDYKNKRHLLSEYLKINLNVLNFIILVFIEVGYVKMKDGLLQPTQDHQTINIKETKTYQKRMSLMSMEKKLLFSSNSELTQILNSWIKVEE